MNCMAGGFAACASGYTRKPSLKLLAAASGLPSTKNPRRTNHSHRRAIGRRSSRREPRLRTRAADRYLPPGPGRGPPHRGRSGGEGWRDRRLLACCAVLNRHRMTRRTPMARHDPVYQWTDEVTTHLPHLSPSQATVLALWSLGMVLARSCALTAVTLVVATWQRRKANTVRQQLREFCYEAAAKQGRQAPGGAGRALLRAAAALGAGRLRRPPTGARPRRHHPGQPLRGAGHQRRLSRLRHPGRLGRPAGRQQGRLAPGVAAAARPAGAGHPAGLDGDRAGRSGAVRPLALPGDRRARLASLPARQPGRDLPAGRAGPLLPAPPVRADGGPALAGARHGLLDQPAGLHPAGLLGGRAAPTRGWC